MSDSKETKPLSGTIVLGFGPQGINWISQASKICGKGAHIGTDTARMAGADFAFGTPELLEALNKVLSAGAIAAQADVTPHLSKEAIHWLGAGRRGMSSNSIFQHITGHKAVRDDDSLTHPYDLSDFIRCKRLLEDVPEIRAQFAQKMPSASKEWAALVAVWDEITQLTNSNDQSDLDKARNLLNHAIGRDKIRPPSSW